MSKDPRYEALRASRLATELSDAQCEALAQRIEMHELPDRAVLVPAGSVDDHLFVIVAGTLGVIKGDGDEAVTLHTLSAGDFAGELSFIDDTERYASLVALGPARVFSLRRPQLEALLATDADLVYRVMRAVVRVAHQVQRRLSIQQVELSNYIYKQHGKY